MTRKISVIGVPSSAGAFANGQEEAPTALRGAGLVERLRSAGADVDDTGDSLAWRWRPDRVRPRAQNLGAVVDAVHTTRERVADATRKGGTSLVLGGDCTVGIGTVAGVLVWENRWAAPVAVALRRSGGQLVASGRIEIQAILAALEAVETGVPSTI